MQVSDQSDRVGRPLDTRDFAPVAGCRRNSRCTGERSSDSVGAGFDPDGMFSSIERTIARAPGLAIAFVELADFG